MNRKDQRAFIESIAPAAQAAQRKWNVPASVTIAQAILESAWGQSALARVAHNFFGIKISPSWRGPSVDKATGEYLDGPTAGITRTRADFRFYESVESSIDDHGQLLGTLPRYRPAMADCDDPAAFAQRLQDCGYSTDPQYARKLVDLITDKDFKLAQYDSPSPNAPATEENAPSAAAERA